MITHTPPSPDPDQTEQSARTSSVSTPYEAEAPSRSIRPPASKRPWIIAIVAIAVVGAIWTIVRLMSGNASAPRYLTAPVAYKNISSSVEETGTVNPVNEVDVGTQVSGTINGLSVDFNSVVHKGQVLATLDPTSLQATAAQVHGALAAAQSNAAAAGSSASQSAASIQAAIATASQSAAGARSAAANLTKAQAQVALTQTTVKRDSALLAQGYISQSQMDTDRAANNASVADVSAAQAALAAAQAQAAAASVQIGAAADQHAASVFQADAAASQAQAVQGQVQQADYNLQRAVITSPIDGVVVSRNVSIGQTVAASFTTPTLFVIASSLKDMQVDASVSEADVGQLRPGARAQIAVPAYPNVFFSGTVQQVRINPTTVSNVVTYDAIIAVHDDSSRLKPGMTADVTIAIDTRAHVLSIPASALLFKPAGSSSGSPRSSGGASPSSTGSTGSAGPTGSAGANAASSTVAGAPGSRASVWVLRGGKPVRVRIVIGLSDGVDYEVRSGGLVQGDLVIIGQLLTQQYSGTNPIGGGPGIGR